MGKVNKQERAEAIERMREWVKPGDTITCVLRHVSRSGMMRHISFIATQPDGSIRYLDRSISQALGYPLVQRGDGIKVGGCGMDMGFSVVYDLGAVMWPQGTPEPHSMRNGEPDRDGGYALKHRWI